MFDTLAYVPRNLRGSNRMDEMMDKGECEMLDVRMRADGRSFC